MHNTYGSVICSDPVATYQKMNGARNGNPGLEGDSIDDDGPGRREGSIDDDTWGS